MMRTEWGAALITSMLANVNRDDSQPPYNISDFAPHMQKQAISLEDAMAQWG